ncbi:MAG: PD40 domain-containing protein [Gemmatimonadota bacterium]|nr:MAG: PD40 domain-containing protein [Gemmatimonadota bacterium]
MIIIIRSFGTDCRHMLKILLQRSRWLVACLIAATAPACAPQEDNGPAVARAPEEGERFFSNLTQLTFGGQNAEAYFAPNGESLIFQRTDEESLCDQQYVIGLDGSGMERVSNGLGRTTCGYFYDGGSRILYSSTFHAGEACPPPPDYSRGYVWGLYDFDIYTSMPDGSGLERLTETDGYTAEATLSPDGNTIVFTSVMDGDLDIYTMNVDGSNLKRLTTTVGYDGGPFFSPDGSKIVYRSWHPKTDEGIEEYQQLLATGLIRPSRMEVWVMNADGSDQRQITDLGHANFAPFFHPDGNRIIFSSNHETGGRDFDLYLIGVDGANLTRVTRYGGFDGFPMFSPDGSKLVFASNRYGSVEGETNIFVVDWVEP